MGYPMMKTVRARILVIVTLLLILTPVPASAEYGAIPESRIDPEVIRIDEGKYLVTPLDGEYVLIDAEGKEFRLKDLAGKPLILLLAYYSCNGLCPTATMKLKDLLREMGRFTAGKDYRVLIVSFDKTDDRHSLKMFIEMTGLEGWAGDSWRVAVMKDKEDIERLTGSVGFKFFWSSRDKMFLHPNTFIFLSPEGRVVRYLYGTPLDIKDVELAITEANFGKSARSGVIDFISMACYSYNFKEGRYTLNYPLFIGMGSLFLGISSIAVPLIIKRKRDRLR